MKVFNAVKREKVIKLSIVFNTKKEKRKSCKLSIVFNTVKKKEKKLFSLFRHSDIAFLHLKQTDSVLLVLFHA